jgi:hypothetical protein
MRTIWVCSVPSNIKAEELVALDHLSNQETEAGFYKKQMFLKTFGEEIVSQPFFSPETKADKCLYWSELPLSISRGDWLLTLHVTEKPTVP